MECLISSSSSGQMLSPLKLMLYPPAKEAASRGSYSLSTLTPQRMLKVNAWRRHWRPTPVLLPGNSHGRRSLVGCSPWVTKSRTRLSDFTFTFRFHTQEKEMATHSSVLAWRIPGMGEPGGLPSIGSHRVGHDSSDLASAAVRIKVLQSR